MMMDNCGGTVAPIGPLGLDGPTGDAAAAAVMELLMRGWPKRLLTGLSGTQGGISVQFWDELCSEGPFR